MVHVWTINYYYWGCAMVCMWTIYYIIINVVVVVGYVMVCIWTIYYIIINIGGGGVSWCACGLLLL